MSTRMFRVLTGVAGIVGVVALGLYYSGALIPAQLMAGNASAAQLGEMAVRYHDAIFLDAWVQGTGALLSIIFYVALVYLAGAATRFSGLMAIIASAVTLVVALTEGFFTFASSQEAVIGHMQTAAVSADFAIGVFGHVFFTVPAPLTFLALGFVILGSRVLPRIFGYLSLALGVAFEIGGFVGLFSALAGPFDIVSSIIQIGQVLWTVAAAIALIVSAAKASTTTIVHEQVGVTA